MARCPLTNPSSGSRVSCLENSTEELPNSRPRLKGLRNMIAPALSVVIPVYNGALTIRALVGALEILQVPGGHEIVLVNDGSEDDSFEVCRTLLAASRVPMTLVNLGRNFGEHNAVMAGLRRAQGAHVITMDDDLQHPPSDVLRLLEHAQRTGRDVIYTYYATKEHSWWRNLGSRFANWSADRLLDKPRGLYLSSFRCMSSFVVEQLLQYTGPFPYVDGLILQCTRSIDRLPVQHLPRVHGRSNYTMKRLVRVGLGILGKFFRDTAAPGDLAGIFNERGGIAWHGMGDCGSAAEQDTAWLGFVGGGRAVSLRCPAHRARSDWRIPGPRVPDREWQTAVGCQGGAAQ